MKHCCQCYSSKSLQWLSFLLHIQTINGKRKPHNDFWVKRSKVNLPMTFWLHCISNRISLRLLITDIYNFVKIWRMMIGRHSEHQMMKRLLVKFSNACFLIVLCVYAILVNCDSISAPYMRFVTKVWLTFYVLEYSLPSHRLFYTPITRKVRQCASHAIPSNRPTEVLLHWTLFKVGNPTKILHA